MPFKIVLKRVVIAVPLLLALLAGCATTPDGSDKFVAAPQPPFSLDTDQLQPGLAVLYFKHRLVRRIDDLPGKIAADWGWKGEPIPYLNHQFGQANVFDSGLNRGIAMELSGFIRLERPGIYRFQTKSNDGVRVYIDGRLLIDDQYYHSDRLSPVAELTIQEPAWYSLRMRYFQRLGLATLQLYWQPPGAADFAIVPAAVLAHRAE
ncbi:MAG TPA: PA14 domain-containing protein [Desulfosarcina sp.]|nr:PA14 domain-containing protein [Desulfosarcina sp.]